MVSVVCVVSIHVGLWNTKITCLTDMCLCCILDQTINVSYTVEDNFILTFRSSDMEQL